MLFISGRLIAQEVDFVNSMDAFVLVQIFTYLYHSLHLDVTKEFVYLFAFGLGGPCPTVFRIYSKLYINRLLLGVGESYEVPGSVTYKAITRPTVLVKCSYNKVFIYFKV